MFEGNFEEEMKTRFKDAKRVAVLAVGDELDVRDCLGYLAGKKISSLRLKGVRVLMTSQMPENFTSSIRNIKPTHVVFIDATEMGAKPGEVAFIDSEKIAAAGVSTHALPLSMVMEYLKKEFEIDVSLIGIQPANLDDLNECKQPLAIKDGIERIANCFQLTFGNKTK